MKEKLELLKILEDKIKDTTIKLDQIFSFGFKESLNGKIFDELFIEIEDAVKKVSEKKSK